MTIPHRKASNDEERETQYHETPEGCKCNR